MSDTRKTTKPNVPNLRFPGFEGEWDKLKVRDFTRVVAGATPATDKKEYWGGVIRWMNSGELNLKRVYEVQGRITQLGYDKTSTKIIPPHSVLIGLAGQGKTRGTAAMNYVELCTNQSIASILPSDSFYSEFLYQNVESRYKELRDISSGDGGRGGLNLQMIYNLYIPHCSMQEQKKIGDFLYLLDQRIAIQNKVIEKYESLIKALRHHLFSTLESVKEVPVADLLSYEQPTKYIVSDTEYSNNTDLTPVLTANKAFILGYTDEVEGIYDKGPCIILDDFTLDFKIVEFPFKVKSSAIKILSAKTTVSLRYIFEYLKFLDLNTEEHKRHYIAEIEPMSIELPEEDTIKSIAFLFDLMDKRRKGLERDQQLLKSQKDYLLREIFI